MSHPQHFWTLSQILQLAYAALPVSGWRASEQASVSLERHPSPSLVPTPPWTSRVMPRLKPPGTPQSGEEKSACAEQSAGAAPPASGVQKSAVPRAFAVMARAAQPWAGRPFQVPESAAFRPRWILGHFPPEERIKPRRRADAITNAQQIRTFSTTFIL